MKRVNIYSARVRLGHPALDAIAALLLTLVALLIAIPLLLVGIAAAAIIALFLWTQAALRRLRQPNGWLDGRAGVRVITRTTDPGSSPPVDAT